MPCLQYPERFAPEKFIKKYGLNAEDVTLIAPNYISFIGVTDVAESDLLDCIADPPPLPPPTVEERLEAAELMIDLLLDTQ